MTDLTPEQTTDLLAHASRFTYQPTVPEFDGVLTDDWTRHYLVSIEPRGGDTWAIRYELDASCWSRTAGDWVYEPRPSERTDEFIADTRFTLTEALAVLPQVLAHQAEIAREQVGPIAEQIKARKAAGDG